MSETRSNPWDNIKVIIQKERNETCQEQSSVALSRIRVTF